MSSPYIDYVPAICADCKERLQCDLSIYECKRYHTVYRMEAGGMVPFKNVIEICSNEKNQYITWRNEKGMIMRTIISKATNYIHGEVIVP